VTSSWDGFEHLVVEETMTPQHAGRCVALCGRTVWAAALACPRAGVVQPVEQHATLTWRTGRSTGG
jgi:hypothetical protein